MCGAVSCRLFLARLAAAKAELQPKLDAVAPAREALVVAADAARAAADEEARKTARTSISTDPMHYGITLLHATGSAAHVEQLKALATSKGFSLDTTGLHRGRKVTGRSEEEIYAALGLPFIEPELREGNDEIAGQKHALPRLVTDHDLHGILHRTRTYRMESTRWRLSPRPPAAVGISISASPITRSPRITPEACRSRRLKRNTWRLTASTSATAGASASSKALNLTSWPTVRSIILMSPGSLRFRGRERP